MREEKKKENALAYTIRARGEVKSEDGDGEIAVR
jgi:hypothetical protein